MTKDPRRTRPAEQGRGRPGAWWAGLVLLGLVPAGCRGDGSTPVLHTAVSTATEVEAPPDAVPPAPAPVVAPGRALWFAAGPGREAIVARERRDHDAARAHLDALLAQPDLDADARGAGKLLRALEHLDAGQPAEAAECFALAGNAPGLAPIALRLLVWEAQAWLDAGQPERARVRLAAVEPATWAASAVGGDARMIEADARRRTEDPTGAEAAYRAYLREHPEGERRFEARAKLARLLLERDDAKAHREALALYDELRRSVPLSDYADEADAQIPALERELGPLRKGAEAKAHERELALVRAETLLDRQRYDAAKKAAAGLLAKGKLTATQRCRAFFVQGTALFKQSRRADAREPFERAARECQAAGQAEESLRVRSRYQAARGRYAEGKYELAGQAFEAIAAQHPAHSYADDALVLAGESWESHGDPERAARAYRAAIETHPGDMVHEARRRLLVMRLGARADAEALALVDAALAGDIDLPVERAKLLYFRGRALERLGRADEAEAAWVDALDVAPLDYPGLQALSRLRERGPESLARGLAQLDGAAATRPRADDPPAAGEAISGGPSSSSPTASKAISGGPSSSSPTASKAISGGPSNSSPTASKALRRAEVLARLGLGAETCDELRHGGIDGWPAIAVLNQAGLHPAAQLELANLGTRWRSTPPHPDDRTRWEGAHPRPFLELIGPGEPDHRVPALLTYAIMQTESRFDPGVTSFAGARGLLQLMPATARGLAKGAGVELDDEGTLFDPTLNLDLGMRYLGRLTARYEGDGDGPAALAIPSYNAGAGAVDRWLRERGDWELDLFLESIPFDETRKYTQSVLGRWLAYRWLYGQGEPEQRLPYLPLTTPRKP
jgi:soluble lytic murein transglycosylase